MIEGNKAITPKDMIMTVLSNNTNPTTFTPGFGFYSVMGEFIVNFPEQTSIIEDAVYNYWFLVMNSEKFTVKFGTT